MFLKANFFNLQNINISFNSIFVSIFETWNATLDFWNTIYFFIPYGKTFPLSQETFATEIKVVNCHIRSKEIFVLSMPKQPNYQNKTLSKEVWHTDLKFSLIKVIDY